MSGFGVNRNPGFNMNNSLSNNIFNGTGRATHTYTHRHFGCCCSGSLSDGPCVRVADGSENVTGGLDLSDFPALADRSRRDGGSNPTPLLNPLAGRAPYGENICMHAAANNYLFFVFTTFSI